MLNSRTTTVRHGNETECGSYETLCKTRFHTIEVSVIFAVKLAGFLGNRYPWYTFLEKY